ncbi:MAG: glutaredoxin [Alcanivorax borkumensis]|jgi:glutaredoxin 3|uniref:Glutaredoxin n=1 Tax=Alcanivorax borkumensis (strain ATCC 700651 / DSM 11573 / NCIMB 13689 / SK2) TaxID=393595 RepID=Q0VM77_ALCBS|nr:MULTISPECIES: glutaredoxin 3 [Alcanivorax]OJH07163.1 MAG: glutaredoxin [Alcanivorax borkumensis]EUC67923.1 glutaredoxin [Alcanivorax sp. 97CO-5]PKG00352.1 glutaredoxin 3 [Alcanivorax sp. 97CO-6]CAL17721.1 glutaredoxin, putative [Alcanivorax borkumensis SK2]BAP15180.1 glutaredoxin [Alcanivorax sp. NBRC 101098]
MARVELYTTSWCPFCVRAKQLLNSKNVAFEDTDVDREPQQRAVMMQRGGGRTVPQIFINDHAVGGCDELFALERAGALDALLGADQ